MKRNLLFLFACGLVVAFASSADAAIVVWQDDDPASAATQQNAGIVVTPVADPTGSAPSATVGSIDVGGAGQWSSISPAGGAVSVPASWHGKDWTFSFDYYIPSNSTFNSSGANPHFYTDPAEDGANQGDMFVDGKTNADDTWHTYTRTGTLGTPATIDPKFIINNQTDTPAGVAMYIDNVLFEVVPEPASLLLLGIAFTSSAALRRRR